MPADDPAVGEVWETTDATGRTVRGILADVTANIVTLVSFTGNRFRISAGRMAGWHFVQAPPNTGMRCTRSGCNQPGILRYTRGPETIWTCPRHLPVGVQAQLTTESIGVNRPTPPVTAPAPASVNRNCLNCGSVDPVEDVSITLPPTSSLWRCNLCNARWVLIDMTGVMVQAFGNDESAVIRQIVDDTRVQLLAENYRIEEIQTADPRFQQTFDFYHRTQSILEPGRTGYLDTVTLYAGIPVRSFLDANGPTASLRLRLVGGPEFRAPVRSPRQMLGPLVPNVEGRPVDGTTRFDDIVLQRTVPAPGTPLEASTRFYVTGEPHFVGPMLTRVDRAFRVEAGDAAQTIGALLEEMTPTPFVTKGSQWRNGSTGDIVVVDRLGQSTESPETVVHFRRVSDDMKTGMVLLQRDFETMFKPYTQERPYAKEDKSSVEVLKDEEWEHVESGITVIVESVDLKRNLIVVEGKGKRQSLPILDFQKGKWKRLIRGTAWDRLLEDEEYKD
jgi:hypothetical protein